MNLKSTAFPIILAGLLALVLATGACSDSDDRPATQMPEGIVVPVAIDPAAPAGALDERYIGYAFDTAQITNGYWWSSFETGPWPEVTPDLESPKLRNLVAGLAPSRLRIGGTACDGAWFCPDEGDCEVPPKYEGSFVNPEEHIASIFTHEDIRRVADFAEAVGARVMFCINVGPGPREPGTGAWTPENARDLIRYAKGLPNGEVFDIWEPGNEVNVINFNCSIDPSINARSFADDVAVFRALVDAEAPGDLVAAPGSYFLPYAILGDLGFTRNLMRHADDLVDIVTWHLYATQSAECPAIGAPNPAGLDTLFDGPVMDMNRGYARYVREAAGDGPIWNGESASAQCGGQAGVSDTMLDALWLADWIGIMAEEGSSALVRQTIVGSDYGLLDPDTFDPRPAFLVYVLYSRTVEGSRLKTVTDRTAVKAHGYCGAGMDGAITAVLSNPTLAALNVEIALDGTSVRRARQWTVGANGDLTATRGFIEGLSHDEDGTIPDPPGTQVSVDQGRAYARVRPNSLAFVVLEPAEADSLCRAVP